jgi:4'-phosphopantetheinyl transferase
VIDWHRREGDGRRLPAAWVLNCGAGAEDRHRLAVRLASRISGRTDITLMHDDNGRPFFTGCGLHLSMASSGGLFALVLAEEPVGIDVERLVAIDPLPLAVLHRDEVDSLGHPARDVDFLALWTAKEAYTKLLGLGFRIPPESFSVELNGDAALVQVGSWRWSSMTRSPKRYRRGILVEAQSTTPFIATCLS